MSALFSLSLSGLLWVGAWILGAGWGCILQHYTQNLEYAEHTCTVSVHGRWRTRPCAFTVVPFGHQAVESPGEATLTLTGLQVVWWQPTAEFCQSPHIAFFPIAKYQEEFTQEQIFLMTLEKSHLASLGLHSNLALTRIAIALLGVIWSLIIHLLYFHYPCDY